MNETTPTTVRTIGNYAPTYTVDDDQEPNSDPRGVTLDPAPFHRVAVFHDGPGDERLGWNDQRHPLADFECRHGRLRTDASPDCGCFTPASPTDELDHDGTGYRLTIGNTRTGPRDPADTRGRPIATPRIRPATTRPADRISDPPQERSTALWTPTLVYADSSPRSQKPTPPKLARPARTFADGSRPEDSRREIPGAEARPTVNDSAPPCSDSPPRSREENRGH